MLGTAEIFQQFGRCRTLGRAGRISTQTICGSRLGVCVTNALSEYDSAELYER
jgi:hypothetical protein